VTNEVVPLVRQVAIDAGASLIDVFEALSGKAGNFPDKVHPDDAGAQIIADTVAAALQSGGVSGTGGRSASDGSSGGSTSSSGSGGSNPNAGGSASGCGCGVFTAPRGGGVGLLLVLTLFALARRSCVSGRETRPACALHVGVRDRHWRSPFRPQRSATPARPTICLASPSW
jgi:hypothetical protein